jgi:hypothetical protein
MIRIERCPAERYRVIGSLQACFVSLLTETLSMGPIVLDLTEVDKADERAVRFLAGLPPERCALVACPRWLALWIERLRAETGDHF